MNEICAVCNRSAIDGMTHPGCRGQYALDGAMASIAYEGIVKRLIYTFKYKPFVTDLQTVLCELFYEGMIQKEGFVRIGKEKAAFVPVPLHPAKLRQRGYNQAMILAKNLGKKLSIPVRDCLQRTKNTPTQVGLPRDKRKENLKDAFALKKEANIQGKTILLVDDITTSGMTFAEIGKLLKKNGATFVYGLALAKEQ